jgi:predicted RNA-binding Zn-ribbon protein involved in translation (DUF1610 family)
MVIKRKSLTLSWVYGINFFMKARIAHALESTNSGKMARLLALQTAYRSYVQGCIDTMADMRRHHVKPADYQLFFAKSSSLSSQLQKCARAQAVNIVTTWVKTLYPQLKRRIYENDFDAAMRSQLCMVGKCQLTQAKKTGKVEITEQALSTWWGWVWEQKTPVVREDLPMWLSEMCITFERARKATSHGGWWAKVSSLENGKRITVPLAPTPFLTDPDVMVRSVLVGLRHGRWRFQFTDKTPVEAFDPTSTKVGVDVGLNVLAATSSGRLIGRACKPRVDRLYRRVQRLRRNRMRQGLMEDSARLARLERRLTGMIKTDTGHAANVLVSEHPDATFVIEDLDLKGCRGSKRFAYRALHHALETKAPVQVVPAAYTSQTCPSCGYVAKKNRSGTAFRCRSCGRKAHADVVGGLNLLGRSEDKQVQAAEHYTRVGAVLRARYRQRRDSAAGRRALARKRRGGAHTVAPVAYCAPGAHSDKCGQEAECP